MRLIDADELKEKAFVDFETGEMVVWAEDIDEAPTVEVEPVKHGKWVRDPDAIDWDIGGWRCSVCEGVNYAIPLNTMPFMWSCSRYCPNCGAKMDAKTE